MEVTVDKGACIGCGACAGVCPDCFHLGDDMKAEFKGCGDDKKDCVENAISACPVGAIKKS